MEGITWNRRYRYVLLHSCRPYCCYFRSVAEETLHFWIFRSVSIICWNFAWQRIPIRGELSSTLQFCKFVSGPSTKTTQLREQFGVNPAGMTPPAATACPRRGVSDGNKQLYWTGDEPILRFRFTDNPLNARHVRSSQQPLQWTDCVGRGVHTDFR